MTLRQECIKTSAEEEECVLIHEYEFPTVPEKLLKILWSAKFNHSAKSATIN